MNALTAGMLLAAMLLAGCAGVEIGGSATSSDRALCEQARGGGVWAAAAGVCIRGGGGG